MTESNKGTIVDPKTPAAPATPAVVIPEGYISQDQVDKIVQTRVERVKATEQRNFASQLEQMGFKGGIEGLTTFVSQQTEQQQEKERVHRESLESSKKYKDLADLDRKNFEKSIAEKDSTISGLQTEINNMKTQQLENRLNSRISQAAVNAVNPQHIAMLLKDRIKTNLETNAIYAVDEYGVQIMDGTGNPLPIEKYVESFLDSNPHYRKPVPGNGTISPNGNNKPPLTVNADFDPKRAINDPVYRAEHKDQILDLVRNGIS